MRGRRIPGIWAGTWDGRLACVAVFSLACLPYVQTPWFEFVDYDDPDHVAGHAIVGRGLSVRGMAWAFGFGTDPATDGWFNWPLTWLSHMADASVFGMWAGGHHAVNVFFHAVNTVLVLLLAQRLGLTLPGALFASAIFAVHPAQVESVAWVSERKTVLCACLMLLSMLAYVRWRDVVTRTAGSEPAGRRAMMWLIGWNVLGVAALLAKPLAVTLPCVLLLIDALPLRRVCGANLGGWLASLARCVPEKLPLMAAVAGTCVWTIASQAEAGAVHHLPLSTRLAHGVVAYATYLRVFFWPVGLGCFHPHPGMPTTAAFAAVATALLAVSILTAVAALHGRLLAVFGWLWFLGTLVPMVGVIQVGGNGWSDRYLYVPIVGLALTVVSSGRWAVASGLDLPGPARAIAPLGDPPRRWLAAIVPWAWVTVLAVLAVSQTNTWRNTETLAQASVSACPTSAEAWNMLAVHQARMGTFDSAADSFARAITLAESHVRRADHLANLGRLLLDIGRDSDAVRAFVSTIEIVPGHVIARRGLGVALTRLGEQDRAAELFRGLVHERPRDAIAWVGLGNALYSLGHAADAAGCYDTALSLDPDDPPTLVNRAWARIELGDRAGAARDVAVAASRGHRADNDLLEALEHSAAGNPRPVHGGAAR